MRVQDPSKAVMEALPKRNSMRSGFWKGFGTSRRPVLNVFLKSLPDRVMSEREKSGKVRILKILYVFTIRLLVGLVEKARAKLVTTSFFFISE